MRARRFRVWPCYAVDLSIKQCEITVSKGPDSIILCQLFVKNTHSGVISENFIRIVSWISSSNIVCRFSKERYTRTFQSLQNNVELDPHCLITTLNVIPLPNWNILYFFSRSCSSWRSPSRLQEAGVQQFGLF